MLFFYHKNCQQVLHRSYLNVRYLSLQSSHCQFFKCLISPLYQLHSYPFQLFKCLSSLLITSQLKSALSVISVVSTHFCLCEKNTTIPCPKIANKTLRTGIIQGLCTLSIERTHQVSTL